MISRSKARTGDGLYRTEKAHSYATAKRRKCRRGFHFSEAVFRGVDAAIRLRWSHEQIVGEFIKEGKPAASQETIYRRIRRDERRGGSLYRCTRIMSKTGRERYRSRPARCARHPARQTAHPRAPSVRLRVGDWEGGTVMGKETKHCLLALVERKTGFTVIRKQKDRLARTVIEAALPVIGNSENTLKTIAFDNGTEFHDYKELDKKWTALPLRHALPPI